MLTVQVAVLMLMQPLPKFVMDYVWPYVDLTVLASSVRFMLYFVQMGQEEVESLPEETVK